MLFPHQQPLGNNKTGKKKKKKMADWIVLIARGEKPGWLDLKMADLVILMIRSLLKEKVLKGHMLRLNLF